MACRRSNWTRPSIVISLFSRVPYALELKTVSRIRTWLFRIRPSCQKSGIFSALARSRRYGRSKLHVLYPMMMSASVTLSRFAQLRSRSVSFSKDMTSAPTMDAQDLRVWMFFTRGFFSPCTVSMLAIWMTGSCSASGKWPLRPWHSMSMLSTRSGASCMNSPSDGWLVMLE